MPLAPRKLTKEDIIDEIVAKKTGEPTTNHAELMKKDEKSIKKIAKKLKIPFSENITHKTADLSKKKLVERITNEAAAVATLVGGRIGMSKETLKHLRKIAAKLKIDTTKVITHRVKYGLKNKGKGLIQVLWERGFIDDTKLSEYTLCAKDDDGLMIPKLLLLHTMENCSDLRTKSHS